MKSKKGSINIIRKCLWCGKPFPTKSINGYQPLKTNCCEEHKRLYEEKRIADMGSTDPEDMERIA